MEKVKEGWVAGGGTAFQFGRPHCVQSEVKWLMLGQGVKVSQARSPSDKSRRLPLIKSGDPLSKMVTDRRRLVKNQTARNYLGAYCNSPGWR